jgi:hypothetical protein
MRCSSNTRMARFKALRIPKYNFAKYHVILLVSDAIIELIKSKCAYASNVAMRIEITRLKSKMERIRF